MDAFPALNRLASRRAARHAAALALVALTGLCGAAEVPAVPLPATLRLGSTPWSPFTNEPDKPRFAIDLVQAALERVGVKAQTTIVPEGTLTPALLEGRFDGSPALWREPEREKLLVYSKSYLENRLVLVGRHGTDVSATTLAAIHGKRVAIVDGYAYGESLTAAPAPAYVPARTVEESLQKVLAGDADYVLMDDLVVQHLLASYPEEVKTRLAIGSTPLLVRSLHFAVRRDLAGAQELVARFDAELNRMIADRSYHRLLRVRWILADADGDGRPEWIPASDQAGKEAPLRRYELMSANASTPKSDSNKRFYVGGKVYEGWTDVPERYKVIDQNRTPWGSQVATVFTFKW